MKKENISKYIREMAITKLNRDIENYYSFNKLTYNKKENRFYLGKLDLHNGYGIILFTTSPNSQSPFLMGYVYSDDDNNWYLKSYWKFDLMKILNKGKYNFGAVLSQHNIGSPV